MRNLLIFREESLHFWLHLMRWDDGRDAARTDSADGCRDAVRRDGRRDTVHADAPDDIRRALPTDPQTSGGLLVACAPDAAAEVVAEFHRRGFNRATCIGHVEKAGAAGIVIGD